MAGRSITYTAVPIVLAVSLSGCAGGTVPPDGGAVISPQGSATGAGSDLTPRGATLSGTIVRVVDGDTVRVLVDGQREDISVRLIGIDTPETVAPGRPVECFGPEASAFAEQILDGARVLLELDPSQGETDRFGRTLAYVWVADDPTRPVLFNLAAIDGGFAEEVTYDGSYTWQAEFIAAEDAARSAGTGRWSACR
jgi:micrococcal nuclease